MSNGKEIWRLLLYLNFLACVVGIYIPHPVASIFRNNFFLYSLPLSIVVCVCLITTIIDARPRVIYLCNILAAIIGVVFSAIDSMWVGRYVSIGLILLNVLLLSASLVLLINRNIRSHLVILNVVYVVIGSYIYNFFQVSPFQSYLPSIQYLIIQGLQHPMQFGVGFVVIAISSSLSIIILLVMRKKTMLSD